MDDGGRYAGRLLQAAPLSRHTVQGLLGARSSKHTVTAARRQLG